MLPIAQLTPPPTGNNQRDFAADADVSAVRPSKISSVSSFQPCPGTKIIGKSELRAFFKAFVNSFDAASPEDERCWGDRTPFDVKKESASIRLSSSFRVVIGK
jgi:hypothetical protein